MINPTCPQFFPEFFQLQDTLKIDQEAIQDVYTLDPFYPECPEVKTTGKARKTKN
jgi:hypothetical protein